MKRSIATALLLCILMSSSLAAEQVTVSGSVSHRELYVGESLTYKIIVDGAKPDKSPKFAPDKAIFETSFDGLQDVSSRSVTIINGKMSERVTERFVFVYSVTAKKSGQFTLPSATLELGGQTYSTGIAQVVVKAPQEAEDFKLRLSLPKTRLYVGEPVEARFVLYFAKSIKGLDFGTGGIPEAFETLEPAKPELSRSQAQSGEFIEVSFRGQSLIARKGEGKLKGREFTTVSFHTIIVAREPGRQVVGPFSVALNAVVGKQRRGFFGDSDVLQKFVIPSNQVSVETLALPGNAPASFTGLVGEYSIEATAEPLQVKVGEPITLTLRVGGPEPMEIVPKSALHRQDDLVRDFKVPKEMAPARIERGKKVFVQTLRARHDKVQAIPAIALSFFDVKSGRYREARSAPIPLSVAESKVVGVQDGIGGMSGPVSLEVEELAGGIAHNYEDLSVLEDQEFRLLERLTRPFVLLFLLLPMCLFFASVALDTVKARATDDSPERRRREAFAEARRTLASESGDEAATVSKALCECLADRLGKARGGFLPSDASRVLEERQHPEREALARLMEDCDAARFSGAEASSGDLRARALELLQGLEKNAEALS